MFILVILKKGCSGFEIVFLNVFLPVCMSFYCECANVFLYSSMRLCTAKYVYEVYVHTFVSVKYGMTQACMNEHTCTGWHV
jgi:hypothetical protein